MGRFKFIGGEETHVELPGDEKLTITVVPGEVVELPYEADQLAEHLWESTKQKVGKPTAPPQADTPSVPPGGEGSQGTESTQGESSDPTTREG